MNKVLRFKNALQASECYSPTSIQARVLVVQASVAAYLTRFAVEFFSYDSLNARKQRNYYQRTTYKDNFAMCPPPRILFWFTSSGLLKRPVLLKYWLLRPFFYEDATCKDHKRTTLCSKSSTIKGLLYAPDPEQREKGTLSDQPQILCVTSMALLCCWGRSCLKIWCPSGLTLRCMPYGRGTLRIPLWRIL